MRAVNTVLDWLIWAGAILACASIAAMSGIIVLEVILRTFFASTLYMTEEFSGYMVLAILALGVAYAREKNSLLTVDFLINMLSPEVRKKVDFVYGVVSLIFCILLDWYVIQLLMKSIERNIMAPTVFRTPLWIPQMLLPIGITLLCLVMLRKLFNPDPIEARKPGEEVLAHEVE
jgi:TRAP-type C4-dicarboxylate transport system permease small subunit